MVPATFWGRWWLEAWWFCLVAFQGLQLAAGRKIILLGGKAGAWPHRCVEHSVRSAGRCFLKPRGRAGETMLPRPPCRGVVLGGWGGLGESLGGVLWPFAWMCVLGGGVSQAAVLAGRLRLPVACAYTNVKAAAAPNRAGAGRCLVPHPAAGGLGWGSAGGLRSPPCPRC